MENNNHWESAGFDDQTLQEVNDEEIAVIHTPIDIKKIEDDFMAETYHDIVRDMRQAGYRNKKLWVHWTFTDEDGEKIEEEGVIFRIDPPIIKLDKRNGDGEWRTYIRHMNWIKWSTYNRSYKSKKELGYPAWRRAAYNVSENQ